MKQYVKELTVHTEKHHCHCLIYRYWMWAIFSQSFPPFWQRCSIKGQLPRIENSEIDLGRPSSGKHRRLGQSQKS